MSGGNTTKKELLSLPMYLVLEPKNPDRADINRDALEELASSMKSRGLLQPILVRSENENYRIEAGHRRFLAAQILGWKYIDAIVQAPSSEDALHLDRAHENLVRCNLNPVEEAKIVWALVHDDGRGVEKVASMLCRTLSWVDGRLEIAKMPDDLKEALSKNEIKVAVAKELCKVKNHETRERLLKSTVEYGASAAVVKQWISDSSVNQFLEQSEVQGAVGDMVAIDRSQVTMPCRICNISQPIDVLRHIWICPECMGAMRELARETQKQLQGEDLAADE